MPIADDIRAIADGANRELDAVHDFLEHSKVVWRSFEFFADAGHTISPVIGATGKMIDQAGLVALGPHYARKYLATFTFRQFASVFESFFFAFFHRVLRHNPWPFAKSQLDLEAVLRARDREEVIAGVLLRRLDELKYKNVREWFEALEGAAKLGCPTIDDIDAIAELKALRDVLEHNAGVANDVYVRKAGKKARYAVGDPVDIDDDYHLASWRLLKTTVSDLAAAADARLTKA